MVQILGMEYQRRGRPLAAQQLSAQQVVDKVRGEQQQFMQQQSQFQQQMNAVAPQAFQLQDTLFLMANLIPVLYVLRFLRSKERWQSDFCTSK